MMHNRKTRAGRPAALTTPWDDKFDPTRPLSEYPRPSLARSDWLSLNGPWNFDKGLVQGSIVVPYPIESHLSGVELALEPGEVLVYRRRFQVPESWRGRRVLLHFEAVDYEARASLNGKLLGSHRGGYSPFCFDITDSLKASGENALEVEVRDSTDASSQARGKQRLEPSGIWYTAASGIWGSVWLEPVPIAHIARVEASGDPASGRVSIKVAIEGASQGERLSAAIGAEGKRLGETSLVFAEKRAPSAANLTTTAELELTVPSPRPWSPESPFLYGLSLALSSGDRVESYAALRKIELRAGGRGRPRIFLNGSPCFCSGVLDQGYWPDGVYTPPSDEALASDIVWAKRLGFNMVRKHAKVESDRWYWHCDRLGMLVWQDIPSGGKPMSFFHSALLGFAKVRLHDTLLLGRFGRQEAAGMADFEREAFEIVDALAFHPCIVAWVPFNEGWGQFHSARIAAAFATRDPSRLVDAASGWYDEGAGDFKSVHDYRKSPRAPWFRKGRAFVLSEFGGLTLKIAEHSVDDKRQFGYHGAADGAALGAKFEALAKRVQALKKRGLSASVYTQIADVEIERNGLLTYDRRELKTDENKIRAANEALRKD
jgi:beta-galactosidase/beta-glucuronidase